MLLGLATGRQEHEAESRADAPRSSTSAGSSWFSEIVGELHRIQVRRPPGPWVGCAYRLRHIKRVGVEPLSRLGFAQ